MAIKNEYLKKVYEQVKMRDKNEPEFLQTIEEVFESLEPVIEKHPEWVKEAHDLGMKVNVWTVNKEDMMKKLIDRKVDYIVDAIDTVTAKLALVVSVWVKSQSCSTSVSFVPVAVV